jgi:hypothetical protein
VVQHRKQPIVKLLKPRVDGFVRRANQMGRDAFLSPSNCPLVKNRNPGDRNVLQRRLCTSGGKAAARACWFSRKRGLCFVIQSGVEMFAHRPG